MTRNLAKRGKIAVIIILVFVILAIIALVLLLKQKNKDIVNTITSTPSSTENASVDKSAASSKAAASGSAEVNWRNYTNSQYHFGLDFSDAWEGYTVATDENLPAKALADFSFKVKTSDSKFNQTATPLIIYIFKQDDFESASANFSSTEIVKANGYVYSYRAWDSAPSDSPLTDKAIADVIKTFKTSN